LSYIKLYRYGGNGGIVMKNKEEILKLLYKIKAEQDKRRA
jgi:hypothetical protein